MHINTVQLEITIYLTHKFLKLAPLLQSLIYSLLNILEEEDSDSSESEESGADEPPDQTSNDIPWVTETAESRKVEEEDDFPDTASITYNLR